MKFSLLQRLKPLMLLIVASVFFFSCATEETTVNPNPSNDSETKQRIISLDDLKTMPGVMDKLQQFRLTRGQNLQTGANGRLLHNSRYNFTVDTDEVLLVEKGKYHSLSFPVYRDSVNGYVENLFLHPYNGGYLSFLFRYRFNTSQMSRIENGTSLTLAEINAAMSYMPLDQYQANSGGGYSQHAWMEDGICVVWDQSIYAPDGVTVIDMTTRPCPGCCPNEEAVVTAHPRTFIMEAHPWPTGSGGPSVFNPSMPGGTGGGPVTPITEIPYPGPGADYGINPGHSIDNGNPIIGFLQPTRASMVAFIRGLNPAQIVFWNNQANKDVVDQIKAFLNENGSGNGMFKPQAVEIAKNWIDLSLLLKDNPGALLELSNNDVQEWLNLIQFEPPQSVVSKINTLDDSSFGDYNIQYIVGARGAICNMDYFPVKINVFPTNPQTGLPFAPVEFLNYVRTNLNNFVDTSISSFFPSSITGYNEAQIWNSSNPVNAIIHINISAPAGDGSVICSQSNASKWMFTTIEVPWKPVDEYDGIHPVSGNREFGIVQNGDGSYTFYTRGADRMTDSFESVVAENSTIITDTFEKPDLLWNSLRNNIYYYVQNNNGQAAPTSTTPPIIHRPSWNSVRRVLIGEIPASNLLND